MKSGINVVREKLFTKKLPNNKLIQVVKYLELCIKILFKYRNYDVIHCNDFGPLFISVFLKYFYKRKVLIYDAHELETEANNVTGVVQKLTKFFEKALIKYADEVITVSNTIGNYYKKIYPFIDQPSIVLNSPRVRSSKKYNYLREIHNISEDTVIFLYQGALTNGRGINLIIDTFKKIDADCVIVFMGFGVWSEKIKSLAKKDNRIIFQPAVDPEYYLDYTASADIGICIIESICLSYEYSLPNKFFEYGMAGLPIITNNLIEVKSLHEQYDAGWILENQNVRDFEYLILKIIESEFNLKGLNAYKMSVENSWEIQEKVLLEVYGSYSD